MECKRHRKTENMGAAASEPASTDSKTSASEDFANLLGTEEFCDATLISNDDHEFRIHSAILAARSVVFKAIMLRLDLREKRDRIVRIEDADGTVLAETLRYIYSGKVENLKEIKTPLMAVARKYMLDGLMDMCVQAMKEDINVDNAVESFTLADLYQIQDLKNCAKDFIRNNVASVVNTPGFKNLKISNSHLLEELYCDLASHWKV
ncbi:hypothetical protein TSAR_009577 [Trichomalopsis sarcophagae]|uniref:BTB domain-containing protein n=1 Tax=Trichomalopsis sarcophagae TaxID=543379 RepID=A0A232FEJ2_9HYME|nr:hypothetical protein TSAR_009577 [Trichomalopsis sarcophagae]